MDLPEHSQKSRHDGGEALLQAFERMGVEYLFSSPGSEWAPIWEALAQRQADGVAAPRLLDLWHETLAVDLAMGYTLVSGKMQAVLLHAAVGLVQGSIGLITATQMEVPMVVMSGESVSFGEDPDTPTEPQWYGFLSDRPERYAAPMVKSARSVAHASTLYGSVLRAGDLAQLSPQGPVFLGLPVEHLHAPWKPPATPPPVAKRPVNIPDPDSLAAVAKMLEQAKNPMIVAESSGRHDGGWEALIAFAEATGAPVIMGRSATYGNFPTDHPLYQGGFGEYSALKDADLILLISPRTPWSPPGKRPAPCPIVAIGEAILKPHMTYQQLHADIYLDGDLPRTLDALRAATHMDAATVSQRTTRWTAIHDEREARLAAERNAARTSGKLNAISIVDALRRIMPDDVMWVDETVSHYGASRHHLPILRPLSFLRAPGGLGQGLGLAVGAKMAAPDRPVVCLVGDGGFLYNPVVQALGAARDIGAPVFFIVFNNHRYHVMNHGLKSFHYPDGAAAAQRTTYGSGITGFDYDQLAPLFGFKDLRVDSLEHLDAALVAGLEATREGQSAILNLILD